MSTMQPLSESRSPRTIAAAQMPEAPLSQVDPKKHKGYLALLSAFNFGMAGLVASHSARRHFAGSIPWQDLLLLGTAAHKLSRLMTTERVTEPLREPFLAGATDPNVSGVRRALGELVTCPYCSSSWMTLALSTAFVAAPVATRVVTSMFTVMTIADFLSRFNMLLRETGELARATKQAALAAAAPTQPASST